MTPNQQQQNQGQPHPQAPPQPPQAPQQMSHRRKLFVEQDNRKKARLFDIFSLLK